MTLSQAKKDARSGKGKGHNRGGKASAQGEEVVMDEKNTTGGVNDNREDISDVTLFGKYLRDITTPLLSAAEEIEIGKRIERAREALREEGETPCGNIGDNEDVRQAKHEMVEANLRLVMMVARHYERSGMPLLDLIQEGNIGLLRAVDKWDYRRGYRFATYAVWWIKQGIERALYNGERMIRVPVHVLETVRKIADVIPALAMTYGREPVAGEIARETGLPLGRVHAALAVMRQGVMSLNAPLSPESDTEWSVLVTDMMISPPEERIMREELQRAISQELKNLTKREKIVLSRRFAIGRTTEDTLEEIGKDLGVSRERVRQIEAGALEKLRHPARRRRLEKYRDSADTDHHHS